MCASLSGLQRADRNRGRGCQFLCGTEGCWYLERDQNDLDQALGSVDGVSLRLDLAQGQEYQVMVRPNCSSGSGSFESLNITTVIECSTSDALTLTIVFDDYPEEISWELTKDSSPIGSGDSYSTRVILAI